MKSSTFAKANTNGLMPTSGTPDLTTMALGSQNKATGIDTMKRGLWRSHKLLFKSSYSVKLGCKLLGFRKKLSWNVREIGE